MNHRIRDLGVIGAISSLVLDLLLYSFSFVPDTGVWRELVSAGGISILALLVLIVLHTLPFLAIVYLERHGGASGWLAPRLTALAVRYATIRGIGAVVLTLGVLATLGIGISDSPTNGPDLPRLTIAFRGVLAFSMLFVSLALESLIRPAALHE